ncbi:MAG TPA: universal stress protein [Rubrobacter sp.]|nr:universal stress protein [Rubrobacter sp.]
MFWSCLWPHLDRRPGQQRLFQHADKLRRALLGSVSDAAVRHAHCPVTIVRE